MLSEACRQSENGPPGGNTQVIRDTDYIPGVRVPGKTAANSAGDSLPQRPQFHGIAIL